MSDQSADVIVIGAGAAGLAASHSLGEAGRRVTLLEARDRIGGRIFSRRHPAGGTVELGAEFIHGRPPELWSIVDRAGLRTHELTGDRWRLEQGRLAPVDTVWAEVDRMLARMDSSGPDQSFTEFLQQHCSDWPAQARKWAIAFVEGFHTAHADRISLHSLVLAKRADDAIEGHRGFRLLDGYDGLIHALHATIPPESLDLRLNTAVSAVSWEKGGVEVVARSAGGEVLTFRAPTAILTLPLGVLQAPPHSPGAVRFSPELSGKSEAWSRLAMGTAIRLVLCFRAPFWADEALVRAPRDRSLAHMSFLFAPDQWFPTWWTTTSSGIPTLTGWAAGPHGEKLSGHGEAFITDRAVEALANVFRLSEPKLRDLLQDSHVHDWQSDPYARGAYSYALVGGKDAARRLAEPLAATLFFAGEATDFEGHNGTVHGAIASGRRAAAQLLTV